MSKKMLRRFKIFILACLLIFLLLGARLAQLQILNHEQYLVRAEINRTRILTLPAPRGEILDREGRVLAANKPGFTVSVLELDRREADRIIGELSRILEMEEAEIRRLIWQQRFRRYIPVRLKTDVNEKVVAELTERRTELPGVLLQVQPLRIYPEENLACHILGRTGLIQPPQLERWQNQGLDYHMNDIVGREGGIEEVWEPYLRGQDGAVLVEVNNLSQTTRVMAREDPVPGDNVYLTLDAEVQRDLEMALRRTMAEWNDRDPKRGLRGTAVALDPRTGAILAMVSLPDFDLNTYWRDYNIHDRNPNDPLTNRAIAGRYPVGSTYKVVPAVAALEEGVLTPATRINSPGVITIPGTRGRTKANFGQQGHGTINLVRALQVSSNTFFYQVGQRLGTDRLAKWGSFFGMGEVTGLVDIRGESTRTLLAKPAPRDISGVMDAAIGQRHAITPLQLANMMAMTANEGIHYRPYLVDRVVDVEGRVIYQAEPEIVGELDVSPQTWRTVKEGLEAAMAAGGTAGRFRNFPYPVKIAGKTGTAEVGIKDIPDHSICISYAPAANPEIVLAVLIERSGTSGQLAVPITWDFYVSYFGRQFESAEE